MSKTYKAVKANLYSVHWQNDPEHGYYHNVVRILAHDALDAIRETIPRTTGKVHVESVDLLAQGITILISEAALTESFETRAGAYSDDAWRKMLGVSSSEEFHGYRGARHE